MVILGLRREHDWPSVTCHIHESRRPRSVAGPQRKFKVPNSTVRSITKKYLEVLENGQVGPTMVIISWKGSVDLSITGRLTT